MKQFWIDFAEGRITVPEMLERTTAEPTLLDWFNTIVPEGTLTAVVHRKTDETGYTRYSAENVPFTVQIMLREELTKGGRSNLAHNLNIHSCLSGILAEAFPEDGITIDETLEKKFDFMLDACPDPDLSGTRLRETLIGEDTGEAGRSLKHVRGRSQGPCSQF